MPSIVDDDALLNAVALRAAHPSLMAAARAAGYLRTPSAVASYGPPHAV
jgi:hypothetical protein